MGDENDSPKTPPEWLEEAPLGESLRERYKEVLNEPIPERLKKLIEALKEKERQEQEESDP